MSQTHTQRLRDEAKRRREQKAAEQKAAQQKAAEQKAAEQADVGQEAPTSHPPVAAQPQPTGGELVGADGSAASPEPGASAHRPQPFTPDLLPSTEAVEAAGEMSADERDELDRCERAFANADQAEWMRGMALHAVRDRRLYREGGRTWVGYCEEIGLSESDANRMILEYPLARAIAQIWVTPKMVPASHVRALLPLIPHFDHEQVAQGYVKLRAWAKANSQRVTAADLTALIERSAIEQSVSDGPLPVAEFKARRKALEAGTAIPAQAGPPADEMAHKPGAQGTEASGTASHPKLGDSPATTTPDSTEHPKSGDQTTGADERDVLDAELVDDEAAHAVSMALTELSDDIETKLRGAAPETLKEITAAAETILNASREALTNR